MGDYAQGMGRLEGGIVFALYSFVAFARVVEHVATFHSDLVSFLLLQQDCLSCVFLLMDNEWLDYVDNRPRRTSRGSKRVGVRTTLFSLFQWLGTSLYPVSSRFARGGIYLWQHGLEHLSHYRMGRRCYLVGRAPVRCP